MDSARRAGKEFDTEVIIMKTCKGYGLEKDPPPCPSVKINNSFLVKKGLISYDQLKAAILIKLLPAFYSAYHKKYPTIHSNFLYPSF